LKARTSLGQAVSSAAALAIAELRGVDERNILRHFSEEECASSKESKVSLCFTIWHRISHFASFYGSKYRWFAKLQASGCEQFASNVGRPVR
jgi:hypothetical protein